MRTVALWALVLGACSAIPESLPQAYVELSLNHSAATVNAALPDVLGELELETTRHEFDGGCGYIEARSPSGALMQIRFDWVVPGRTYLEVQTSRAYGWQISNAVWDALEAALDNPG